MSLSAPTPPLLLTKRLTAFLRTNLSPQIHTALLTTQAGKLLAHASPHPVSTLRTQSTVAASLWALYTAPATESSVSGALPSQSSSQHDVHEPSAVTVQLTNGILVIRRLSCNLLFVCLGPSGDGVEHLHAAGRHIPQQGSRTGTEAEPTPLGSPSEVESVTSAGAATTISVATNASVGATGVVILRRQAEELAKWLDDALGSLGVPEEGTGVEGR